MKKLLSVFVASIIALTNLLLAFQPAEAISCRVLDPYYVSQVQRGLANKGYSPGAIDGLMGTNTCNAIIRFQKAKKLTPDGIVGANTGNALGLSKTISCGSGISACFLAVERTGYQGTVYAIRSGKVIKKLAATFGGNKHRTPTGTYSIYKTIAGAHTSTQYPSEEPNMNYPLYFRAGYAIHGSKSVGSASGSHGCVRIGWDASKDLYYNYYKKYGIKTIVVRR